MRDFPKSRRRREKNDLSVAFSHVVPTTTQQANLFVATNEGRQTLDDAGFESTRGRLSPITRDSLVAPAIPLRSCSPRSS